MLPITSWLPITKKDALKRGQSDFDVILVSGDAYIDHPSFGCAVIGRLLESLGLSVAIIAQPNWQDDLRDFKKFGAPKLFFGISSGCMDSMVNHYTAHKRKRSDDAFTPGGKPGFRPDRAVSVYTSILKKIYPDSPVLIGGIEASLRRVTHYDYWSDSLRPTILAESGADMLVYGMGEQPFIDLIKLLVKGVPFHKIDNLKQTAVLLSKDKIVKSKKFEDVKLNSHEDCLASKHSYALNFKVIEIESNKQKGRRILQNIGDKTLVINPPYEVMSEKEIDRSFDLPYTRLPHPKYRKRGLIPAYEMIKHSVNTHRGCFGGCSFCTISAHQGKLVASRSEKSILKEIDSITHMDDFKGYLSDIGGPSANMWKMKGIDEQICKKCSSMSCIFPSICKNLDTDHSSILALYRKVKKLPKIKKAFISSGIRYDLLIKKDKVETEYIEEVIRDHVSGRLKVAPEHTEDHVVKMMRKPSFNLFYRFKDMFEQACEKFDLNQQIIPYFISSHPGCDESDMKKLADKKDHLNMNLKQVQDFTPTPMTYSTEIYYTGVDPYNVKREIKTVKSLEEKKRQKNYFF